MKWDIFCSVVDNYGDIGVTWRLARQLCGEHGMDVRLWVDDLHAFAHICPQLDVNAEEQSFQGVKICHWSATSWPADPADVVIEAFACEIPEAVIQAMQARSEPCIWINLEYLTAETWAEGCHGLSSLRSDGLRKTFFFPGFTEATGGLLRERDLLNERERWQQNRAVQTAFLTGLGVERQAGTRLLSLFSYENAALPACLDAMQVAEKRSHLLVFEGRALRSMDAWAGKPLRAGDIIHRGNLTLQVIPFVSQQDYDRLLWSCDANLIRGEDSFVRAQWAARPMLWHIYPQEDNAHWAKLDAFLALYTDGMEASLCELVRQCWHGWNRKDLNGAIFTQWLDALPELLVEGQRWCSRQGQLSDLTTKLVQFCAKSL